MNEDISQLVPHEVNQFSCRVCLQNEEICNSFYDIVSCNGENKELKELYSIVIRIEIGDDEEKPTQICESCTSKLLTAFEFILNAEKSEEFLAQYSAQIDKSPLPTKDFDYNIEIGLVDELGDDSSQTTTDNNDVKLKIESIEENITKEDPDSLIDEKDCEQFEILDGFELLVEKDTEESTEEILGQADDALQQKNVDDPVTKKKATTNSKARNSLGSRLSHGPTGRTNRYNCTECQRSFAKLQSFQRHIENAHTYAPREEIAAKQLQEASIQCPECPRTFMHRNDLQRHMLAIHPEVMKKESSPTDMNIDGGGGDPLKIKRKYNRGLCPHCGREFPVASLNIHIRRHLGVNPYKCQECGKAFPRKQDLTVHERHHSGERPHVCTVCGKAFIRPNKLSRHMRIHLGIRPYKCEECGKSFSQSNDLKLHLRRHSGEKPYVCGICGESYISGTLLRVHRRTKEHYEETDNDPDPFINCRVNTRPILAANSSS